VIDKRKTDRRQSCRRRLQHSCSASKTTTSTCKRRVFCTTYRGRHQSAILQRSRRSLCMCDIGMAYIWK